MPRLRHAAPFVWLLLLAAMFAPASIYAADSPSSAAQLSLPTPVGERWKILQGYGCGTHNSWDRYSLDLVAAEGKTYGAPVRAAADGVVFAWTKKSGTLILSHGSGLYTMYTHMSSVVTTRDGTFFPRGALIGSVGDRGAPGIAHLHFTAFTADGAWARNRRSIPLSFAEGYHLPDTGGCSQHQGEVFVAADPAKLAGQADHESPTLAQLAGPVKLPADTPTHIEWLPATDSGSGVAGYRLYVGPDPSGTSEWFVPNALSDLPALKPGTYLLRLQALDAAGNASDWLTVAELLVG
jgi:murein DD-endopeptidase MepM/ murein hydrolase activator NlpD